MLSTHLRLFEPWQPLRAAGAVMMAPAVVANGAKRLDFPMESPVPSEWCWAATVAAVCTYYARGSGAAVKRACDIATQCLATTCCPPPVDPDDPRNRRYDLTGALRSAGHLAGDARPGPIAFDAIAAEIDAGRPICCHVTWESDPDLGHFNAICGYDASNQDVDVIDCVYHASTLPYATFASAYQGVGRWDWTYLTR